MAVWVQSGLPAKKVTVSCNHVTANKELLKKLDQLRKKWNWLEVLTALPKSTTVDNHARPQKWRVTKEHLEKRTGERIVVSYTAGGRRIKWSVA